MFENCLSCSKTACVQIRSERQKIQISGRRGSNSRRQPWEGCILPLNYVRLNLYTNIIPLNFLLNKF